MKVQSERLGTAPIPKLLLDLALPATVGMVAMALHNVIDAIYIGRGVGTEGVAAAAITFPLTMIIMALSGAIGIGGASVVSRALGAGLREKADQAFGSIISMTLIVGIAGIVLGLTYLTPMLRLFGASDAILPYGCDYLGIILYGTAFFSFSFAINNLVRAEGNARVAMATMITSSLLNILLTPIFMFGFNLGIKGAAYGTVFAQFITSLFLLIYFMTGKSSLTIRLPFLVPRFHLAKEILTVGASAFVRQGSSSVMIIIANNLLLHYGGDLALAALGIIHRVIMFTLMPSLGIVQGALPIVGFNYGAKQKARVNEAILLAIKAATVISSFAFILVISFPGQFMRIFTDDPALINIGIPALRLMFSLSFTIGMQMVVGGVFQALGKAAEAFIMSMARQVIFLIPALFLFPLFWGLEGIWLAFPVADLFALVMTFILIRMNKEFFTTNHEKLVALSR